jgi:hypothetical protein
MICERQCWTDDAENDLSIPTLENWHGQGKTDPTGALNMKKSTYEIANLAATAQPIRKKL